MSNKPNIHALCSAIANGVFLNVPFINKPGSDSLDLYKAYGFANKATGICHYCSIGTLKSIIENSALRFSDIRFLNDSTEFIQAVSMVEYVLEEGNYSSSFKNFIRNSEALEELKTNKPIYKKSIHQSYIYRTYTCSLSTDQNSLNMWSYYGANSDGLNISFNHAWNIFEGDGKSDVNVKSFSLDNDGILLSRGLILYSSDDKISCITKCLDQLYDVYKLAQEQESPCEFDELILHAFKKSINNLRCYFKDASFLPEKEYRITLSIPEHLLLKKDSLPKQFKSLGCFQKGNILVPYVDYKFNKESIEQIVVNPYIKGDNTLFEQGIKELLWSNGLGNVPVFQSGIPLRNYN